MMKYVYICHPLRGDVEGNLEKVKNIVREVCCEEIVAFAPHLAFAPVFADHIPEQRARGISTDLALLRSGKIDELWVYGEQLTEGMKFELEVCLEHNIPIRCKSPMLNHAVRSYIRAVSHARNPAQKSTALATTPAIASVHL